MLNKPLIDWGTNFVKKFDLNAHSHILDIGCRAGHITSFLAKQNPKQHFLAIDNQSCLIDQAMNELSSNLHFETMDVLTLPFQSEFDAITSFNCLLWVKDKQTALRNIYHALKPGGKAYLQLFAIHGRPKNDRFLYQCAQSSRWQHYFKGFAIDYYEITLGELYSMLQNLGFIIHRIEFAKYETLFEHRDQLQEWMGHWASHKKALPKEKHDTFMDETISSYLKYHGFTAQEPFAYYEYLLEVICEKPEIQTPQYLYRFGSITFTLKEAFVLKHFLQGKTAKEIAQLSKTSAKTVEFHLGRIKEKCQCQRRSEIYQAAINEGFINLIFDNKL